MSTYSNPFAETDLQPVSVAGKEVSKIAVRVKDDAGEYQCVGILGENYNLIKNSIARDVSHDIMSRSGMEWKGLKTHWDGKRYIDYFYTANPIISIKNGHEYPIHLGMMIRNSYDGSSVFGLEFYAMNMICSNQYIARKAMGYFAIRHSGNEQFDIDDSLKNISQGSQRLIDIAPRYQAMIAAPMSVEDIVNAQQNELVPNSQWGNVLGQLGKEQEYGKIFGLYQALTFVTSHEMSGLSAIKKGNDVTEYFFAKY